MDNSEMARLLALRLTKCLDGISPSQPIPAYPANCTSYSSRRRRGVAQLHMHIVIIAVSTQLEYI